MNRIDLSEAQVASLLDRDNEAYQALLHKAITIKEYRVQDKYPEYGYLLRLIVLYDVNREGMRANYFKFDIPPSLLDTQDFNVYKLLKKYFDNPRTNKS